jgi:xanthine dehydrogenase YagR molybdenum-binding subunit
MRFTKPAGRNPIDQLQVVGQPITRIDGPLKVTGAAPYAYEWHDVAANQAYGYILGAGVAKGCITRMDIAAAKAAPGVVVVVTALEHEPSAIAFGSTVHLFGGATVAHYHQAIALVVAETTGQVSPVSTANHRTAQCAMVTRTANRIFKCSAVPSASNRSTRRSCSACCLG